MNNLVEERAEEIGLYIMQTSSTVRNAAKRFGISKSTVHTDVTKRLENINPSLFEEVRKVLEINKAQRHIRGGIATRQKYKDLHNHQKSIIISNDNK